jgi:hypothetical protein
MRYLAIVEIVKLEATPFLTINLYGEKGYVVDQLIAPYDGNPQQAVDLMQQLIKQHGRTLDCWLTDKEIFVATLSAPGINGQLKHRDDTKDCEVAVKSVEEVLRELYEIEPIIPLPKLSAWRKRLFVAALKIANKISGGGKYDIV